MKTINFTQEVEVIETYDIDYSQSDFEYDCEVFKITNLSFDELCDKTGMKPAEISSELIRLEMFGLVRKGNGNIYYKM